MKPRKSFLDASHPMFARPWVCWLTTLAPMAWGCFELWKGDPMWGVLFLGAGVYAGWTLIYKR